MNMVKENLSNFLLNPLVNSHFCFNRIIKLNLIQDTVTKSHRKASTIISGVCVSLKYIHNEAIENYLAGVTKYVTCE